MRCRQFTPENQKAFAKLSGDYNPLHVDAVASRRLIFGTPVVHGIHALLWGLDCLLENNQENMELESLRAVFPKPIRVGEEVFFSFIKNDDSSIRIELSTSQSIVTIITVTMKKVGQQDFKYLKTGFPEKLQPRDLSDNDIENDSDSLALYLNIKAATELFPCLIKCFSLSQIAAILSTTRIVGAKCPGLHSIYSEIALTKISQNTTTTMDYKVTMLDKRIGLVLIKINSPDMEGTIKAFRRPAPLKQASYLSLKNKVESNEFSDQRALVIGGSRGLGEVVAKLLAGGGANVKISYYRGQEDAMKIVDEIVSNGGIADSFQYDVLSSKDSSLDVLMNDWMPTHLYYFATPFIFSGAKGVFSSDLFNNFCDYYVTGFINILDQLRIKSIFYPSTVAIDELPTNMCEYTVTKMASETLCDLLEKGDSDMTIYKPRFPRVATDQTASIIPVINHDPVPLMIKELRSFKDILSNKKAL